MTAERWVVQFCHCHYGPFLDMARQYAALFKASSTKVLTVFLTGEDTPQARAGCGSDEVAFMNFRSADVRGLKLKAMAAFRKIVASRDVAFVIAHRFKPIFIACLATDLPVIGVHHAFGDYRRLHRQLFARYYRDRLFLLGVSRAVAQDIRDCLPGYPQDSIAALHNRIDPDAARSDLFGREEARHKLNIPQDAYVIGNVGRLHADKDQKTLIEGFARAASDLPADSLLVIVGTGELEAELRQLAHDRGVGARVRFTGQVPEARRYFPAFDLFALTSDHEPFGMVLLEAMAADLPIVCADCGGAPEVVTPGADLFPLADAGKLAELLVRHGQAPRGERHDWRPALAEKFSDQAGRRLFARLLQQMKLPVLPETT